MATIILRFRDLNIPAGQTVRRHREKIRAERSTWWGWIARQREVFPQALLQTMAELAALPGGKRLYLYHSGECQFYPAIVCAISAYPGGARILTPEVHKTPTYMSEAECPAWFELISIEEPISELPAAAVFSFPTISEITQVDDQLFSEPTRGGELLRNSSATLWAIELNADE